MSRDYYLILGVDPRTSSHGIKKAFRRLAKKYHPDLNPDSRFLEEKFRLVIQAYEILGDPLKRREYDKERREKQQQQSRSSAARSKSFTRSTTKQQTTTGAWSTRPYPRPQPGKDVEQEISVPFEVAMRGGKIQVSVNVDSVCPVCMGTGGKNRFSVKTCQSCHGCGWVHNSGFFTSTKVKKQCEQCGGRGKIIEQACVRCRGEGSVFSKRKISVQVPAGIQSGGVIRLKGLGLPGANLGPRGCLLLKVKVLPHPQMRRLGRHIETTVWLDMVTATLGGRVPVPTLSGMQFLKVEAGTRSGDRVRLKGKGIPGQNGDTGDQFVVFGIKTPKELTDRQIDLLRELRRTRMKY